MNVKHFQDSELTNFLLDDSHQATNSKIQQHLENCRVCQQRLTELAAADDWWTKTASHLSTMEQIRIPADILSQMSKSAAIVVANSVAQKARPHAHRSAASDSEIVRTSLPTSTANTNWQHILDPPTHPEMLGRIDQFEIEGKIGSGGMGLVLRGFDRNLNRAVAIKVLAPHLACNGTARLRFAREAQAAAAVVHPNVVPIYAVKSCESRPYLVMQLVSGHSLQTLVQEKGPLDVKEIVRIGIQVADGLAAAHQQGLIHRDIKPANVLIEQDVSRVMITDFGLARATDDAGITQSGWIAGTPHYMSPEQSSGLTLDCRTDLFSLGGLLYYLATGREPFRGENSFAVIQKIINEPPISPQELNSDLPAMISEVIERLLEKKPDDRFQSASAVRQWLESYLAYLQQPTSIAQPQRVWTRRRRRIRKWKLTLIVGAAISLALATLLFKVNGLGQFATRTSSQTNRWLSPTSPGPPHGPAANSDNSKLVAALPTLASFFEDAEFDRELEELEEQISELERNLQSPITFSIPSPWDSDASESERQFLGEVQELQETTERLLREEALENARLQNLLDTQRNQDVPSQNEVPDLTEVQSPLAEPQTGSNPVETDKFSDRK